MKALFGASGGIGAFQVISGNQSVYVLAVSPMISLAKDVRKSLSLSAKKLRLA